MGLYSSLLMYKSVHINPGIILVKFILIYGSF